VSWFVQGSACRGLATLAVLVVAPLVTLYQRPEIRVGHIVRALCHFDLYARARTVLLANMRLPDGAASFQAFHAVWVRKNVFMTAPAAFVHVRCSYTRTRTHSTHTRARACL